MGPSEGDQLPERRCEGGPRGHQGTRSASTFPAPWPARGRRLGTAAPSPRRGRRGWSRAVPFVASAILLLAGIAVGRSALVATLEGAFELPPGALPANSLGGSALSVQDNGATAQLTLWAAPGVPTYFLPALLFVVRASTPPQGGSAHASLTVSLVSGEGSLPVGEELYALVEPYASPPSSELSAAPFVPGGELRAPQNIPSADARSPFDGLSWGMDVDSAGITWVGSSASMSFSLTAGGEGALALSVGVLLVGGGSQPSPVSFTLTITLGSPAI